MTQEPGNRLRQGIVPTWVLSSKSDDQSRVDQQPVEAARLRAVAATIEQPTATLKDALLLRELRVERKARRLQHNQRQIGRVEHVECGRQITRPEIDAVDGVVGG